MADDTLTPSTPGSFGRDGEGVDLHGAIRHVERVLGWLKDHLIQSGDTSLSQYDTSLAQTGSVRQAPDPDAGGGMTPARLAQAASRTPTQYQRGNAGGTETAPSTPDPVADILRGVTVPDPVRSAAWKAYYDTTSLDDFTARVKGVAIPDTVKSQLWKLKLASSTPRITVSPAIEADARLGPHTMTDSEPSWYENLLSALKPLAQPRTVDDIGHILMAPTDATRGGLSIPAVSRTVTRAADATGRGVEAVGTGLEAAGQSQPVKVLGQGGALYAAYHGDLTKAAIALLGPSVLTTTGRIVKATGRAMQTPFNGLPLDRYAPNTSGYEPGAAAAEGASAVRTPSQATYTQLPDGTWGITGRNLVPGESVHVVTRSGAGHMMKVGAIVDETGGVRRAMLAGQSPAEAELIAKVTLTQAEATQALGLVKQGQTPSDALKAVLAARQE